jgi:hypothetical protein
MRRGLLAVAGVLVAVLLVGQLVLPGLAARRLRSDLEKHGSQVSVHVSAFPAIKLLWHKADRVTVSVADYRSGATGSGTSLPELLARTKSTGELDVHVRVLNHRLLRMQDVRLRKDGDVLIGQVRLRRRDIDAALPPQLRLSGHSGPDGLAVAGVTEVFGRRVTAQARISVDNRGRVLLRPEGIPLASLVSVPVFSDDRVAVDAVGARAMPDGFVVTARGHLR